MITVATLAFGGTTDTAANLDNIERWLRAAAAQGADLVVFPEACLQGYPSIPTRREQPGILAEVYRTAERVPDGPNVARLARLARELGLHVVYGLTERGDRPGIVYNTAVLTGPDGHIGHFRKVHLGLHELVIWQAGEHWPVFETALGRIGILICYDKAWPESARELTLGGADILVLPSAWGAAISPPSGGNTVPEQYDLYERARALENHRWFVSSNYAGPLGGASFFGLSQVIDPTGRVVASSGVTDTESMVLTTIDVEGGITSAYAHFLGARLERDRRPETYTRIGPQPGPAQADRPG